MELGVPFARVESENTRASLAADMRSAAPLALGPWPLAGVSELPLTFPYRFL